MNGYSSVLFQWVVTILLSVISLFGVILSLACIYALPDRSVNPFAGSFYYICATFICIALLSYSYIKERKFINSSESKDIVVKGLSDKIIKWSTILIAITFILSSILFSFICIYALPNKTSSPAISALFFFCGFVTLVFLIWRTKKIN